MFLLQKQRVREPPNNSPILFLLERACHWEEPGLMRQQALAMQCGFGRPLRTTRRGLSLDEMIKIVPRLAPYYPKVESGHPPVGPERMLRPDFLHRWFDLSNPSLEDAQYELELLHRT